MLIAEALTGPVDDVPSSVMVAPDPADVADYLHDESKLAGGGASSVAVPESVAELRRVMRWHADRHHRLVISATRTGVAGGGVPLEGEHVVSLAHLRGVLRIDAEGTPPTATVLAGTWLSELTAQLAAEHPGLVFPVDPTETSASIGGMVATNAAGARSFRFGATRAWVEALTVELASGRTLRLRRGVDRADGSRLALQDGNEVRHVELAAIPKPPTKNSVGYGFTPNGDIVDLFVGAEGTLGVVSEVTLRLVWQREGRMGFLQFFADTAHAFRFVSALRGDDSLRTAAVEFLDTRSHTLARESGKPEVERVLQRAPREACSIFAEIGWEDEAELEGIVDRLELLVRDAGGDPAQSLAGTTDEELRDIRTFRHAVPERVNAVIAQRRDAHPALHKIATDMAVADADLAWVYALYHARLSEAGLDFAAFGHVGDNHFHVNILPHNEEELRRAKAIYADIARDVVARGGCVAAEHGIGRIKRHFLPIQYPADVLTTMRAIKRWADPEWRLSPGVLLDP